MSKRIARENHAIANDLILSSGSRQCDRTASLLPCNLAVVIQCIWPARSPNPLQFLFGKMPAFLRSGELKALSEHYVSSAQAAVRAARITADIRIDASAASSRRFWSCLRVLLNASRVNAIASRGSSVNREATP
ncbi:MAG: hypothetical protein DME74_10085 [Verrucomicrobia bacterium]|nr:MAG: hypothetical protein DME74_10085 [Verrucomicrobiota bacterium]